MLTKPGIGLSQDKEVIILSTRSENGVDTFCKICMLRRPKMVIHFDNLICRSTNPDVFRYTVKYKQVQCSHIALTEMCKFAFMGAPIAPLGERRIF